MQVKKTALADEDLINLLIYGSQNFGLTRAKSYYNEINQMFNFLAENPLTCRERLEFDRPIS